MANFFAYTRPKLPRNRKETTYVRFLIKLLKRFSGQRKERIGVRIRFQGRVNRWRRTKPLVGEKGYIAYLSYATRIEYGIAQAITRKGALGIRIWLCYKSTFIAQLRKSIFDYRSYSTVIKKI